MTGAPPLALTASEATRTLFTLASPMPAKTLTMAAMGTTLGQSSNHIARKVVGRDNRRGQDYGSGPRVHASSFQDHGFGGQSGFLQDGIRGLRSHPGSTSTKRGAGGLKVVCISSRAAGGECGAQRPSGWDHKFEVEKGDEVQGRRRRNWDLVVNDVKYLDWRARNDVHAILEAHDKVAAVLNPTLRENKSVGALRAQLADLQAELEHAHGQVHLSEARVEHTLNRLADLEARLPTDLSTVPTPHPQPETTTTATTTTPAAISSPVVDEVALSEQRMEELRELGLDRTIRRGGRKKGGLDISGPQEAGAALRNFWYPVSFTKDLGPTTLVPLEVFDEPWVLFRDENGRPGCIRDSCAHRSCPLSLGSVTDGKVSCPYHGWEYNIEGSCTKMPSTVHAKVVRVAALPCVEQDGFIWVWPGTGTPSATLPDLRPPQGFTLHAEILMDVPVEHGLLVENLLDLAHAPFTHTTTFAKGWSVPDLVKFRTNFVDSLRGHWDPYPIDMEFRPPCEVVSVIGIAQPGKLGGGASAKDCDKHLHQLHVCVPGKRGQSRLLYRMSLDFAPWVKYIPFIDKLWENMARQVLGEDLRLVVAQQDRMLRGANVWNHPVPYDKLGVNYRRWRKATEEAGVSPEESKEHHY